MQPSPLLLGPDQLVAALPIGASLVVAARTLLGVRTVGVFAPVLLSMGLLALGLERGVLVVIVAIAGAAAACPLVARLALPRVARLGLVLCAATGALQLLGLTTSERATLPILTIAVLTERCWDVSAGDGWKSAARLLSVTGALAIAIALVIVSPPMADLLDRRPGWAVLFGAVLIVVAGSYRGLRLGERRRFRSLLATEPV